MGITVLDAEVGFTKEDIAARLDEDGIVVFRNLFDPALIAKYRENARALMQRPEVAGVPGYKKVDFPKRILNPFAVGGEAISLSTDQRVIDGIEAYMGAECLLAEAFVKLDFGVNYVYFRAHSDFDKDWIKGPSMKEPLGEEKIKLPVACGAGIYLEDSDNGAFCYAPGTHKWAAHSGLHAPGYSAAEQEEIKKLWTRCNGKAGDMVVFDDRGFHGPDQPSTEDRLLLLLDYYNVDLLGYRQVTPLQVYTRDLGGITPLQQRVLGFGADVIAEPTEYSQTRFKKTSMYKAICAMMNFAYVGAHLRSKVRQKVKGTTVFD